MQEPVRSVRADGAAPIFQERLGDAFKPVVHFTNPNYREALDAVLDTVRRRTGVLLLTGEPGTGKTLLIRHAINELRGEVQLVTLFAPRLSFREIVELAGNVLHMGEPDAAPSVQDPAARFGRFLDDQFGVGRPVVIFVDDAHTLPESTLAELFRFIRPDGDGHCRLQAILSGLPRLEALTEQPDIRDLVGEGLAAVRLLPLSQREAAEFAGLLFASTNGANGCPVAADAMTRIAELSGGVRRLVCTLVDAARMTAGLEASGSITAATVDEAVAHLAPAWAWEADKSTAAAAAADSAPPPPAAHETAESVDPLPSPAFRQILASTVEPMADGNAEASPSPIPSGSGSTKSRAAHPVEVHTMKDNVLASVGGRETSTFRIDNLNKVLKGLQHGSPDVEAAALISEDGLMIASALPQGLDDTRVAGMSATLLSLGTRAAHELGRGDVQEVIVRGMQGYAVMIDAGRGVLLLVVASENAKLGLIFFDMREAIQAIRRIL